MRRRFRGASLASGPNFSSKLWKVSSEVLSPRGLRKGRPRTAARSEGRTAKSIGPGPRSEIDRRLRAFTPWPGVFTFADGDRVKILEARPGPPTERPPGELWREGDRVRVAAGDGTFAGAAPGSARRTARRFRRRVREEPADGRAARSGVTRRITPARARAVSVLREVLERGARASALVTRSAEDLAPEDAGLLRELVLGVLRWKSALDEEIQAASRAPLSRLAPDLLEILEVALFQIRRLDRVPDYAAVDEAVRHARACEGPRAAGFVNAVLRKAQRTPVSASEAADSPERLALRFSHPTFLVARWWDRFGPERTREILQADNEPSPLDLMCNPRRTDRETLARALASEGIATESSTMSPLGLTVRTGNPIRSHRLAAGEFAIQDVGSQCLPLLLPEGRTLVDLAAAPGGKSFASLALRRSARAVSLDRSLERLRLLDQSRRRLGMLEAMPVAADARVPPLAAGRFERVLFDAPCSGTGTLRKNPEIRYRITPQAIARLARAQEELLTAALDLLSPGGYLLYSTCSLEREENEDVVARAVETIAGVAPAEITAPEGLAAFVSGSRFQLLPSATSDGFTAHLLRKASPQK